MLKKCLFIFVGIMLLIIIVYALGPSVPDPVFDNKLPDLPSRSTALETYVQSREMKHDIKEDNQAQIIWANPLTKNKTEVSVLYLHGFSASQREGYPIHSQFAQKYGCNLHLARLADHGIDTTDAMLHLTADRLWNSAKEAYALAKQLGKNVVIMSTSTGGTLALKLAATYPEIKGLINFSPNLAINDPAAFLLNDPWGLQIARQVFDGKTRTVESDETYRKYWYSTYRLESIIELESLVESVNKRAVFEQVTCPVFNGVYYQDENHQDPVIKVSAVRRMHNQLGTPKTRKTYKEFPTANTHVIACDLKSEAIEEILAAICDFAETKLEMKVVNRDGNVAKVLDSNILDSLEYKFWL